MKILLFPLLLAVALLFAGCGRPVKLTRNFFALDTYIEITAVAPRARNAELDSVRALILTLDSQFSISTGKSEIHRLNRRTGDTVVVSPGLASLLRRSGAETDSSGGLFDVTMAPFKYLYGLESHDTTHRVPSAHEIDSVRALTGFGRVRFIGDTLVLPSGMTLDLGGVAKGYILEQVRARFLAAGITNFLVNLGGDLVAGGLNARGEAWNIGIRSPRGEGGLAGTVRVGSGYLFTSGDYERFFIRDGVRYHHLIDPCTGMPGRHNQSASVFGADPVAADAVVKAVFLLPADSGLAYAARRGMTALVIDSAGMGHASMALKESLQLEPSVKVEWR